MSNKARTTQDIIDDLRRFIGGMQYTGDGEGCDIGAAADYLEEAADRLEELQAQIKPPCVWTHFVSLSYDTACGAFQTRIKDNDNYCPHCGGKITLKRKSRSKS